MIKSLFQCPATEVVELVLNLGVLGSQELVSFTVDDRYIFSFAGERSAHHLFSYCFLFGYPVSIQHQGKTYCAPSI